ncbi:MAG: hypothetical protein ACRD45_01860, partial [Bryobacteraceae bacterium]
MPGELAGFLPTIAITMGDPSGIGPEIVLKALADAELVPLAHWVVVGERGVLAAAERMTGIELQRARLEQTGSLFAGDFRFGKLDGRYG